MILGPKIYVCVQPEYNDNYWIEIETDQPRFIAAAPKHINMYAHMQLSIADQYLQFSFNKTMDEAYLGKRAEIYSLPFKNDYGPNKDNDYPIFRKFNQHGFHPISAIISSRLKQDSFLKVVSLEENVLEQTRFRTRDKKENHTELHTCVNFNNDSFKVDYDFLKKIAGNSNEQHNKTCP